MERIFNHKNFYDFFWKPLGSKDKFFFKFILSCQQFDTGGKFAAGIVDTGGKFASGINNASETGGKICRRGR
jgi:hypothetical protein